MDAARVHIQMRVFGSHFLINRLLACDEQHNVKLQMDDKLSIYCIDP